MLHTPAARRDLWHRDETFGIDVCSAELAAEAAAGTGAVPYRNGIMTRLPFRGFEKCSLILAEHNPEWIWQFISKRMYQQAKYCHRQI